MCERVFLKMTTFVNTLDGGNVAFLFLHFRFFKSDSGAWNVTSHDCVRFMAQKESCVLTKTVFFSYLDLKGTFIFADLGHFFQPDNEQV